MCILMGLSAISCQPDEEVLCTVTVVYNHDLLTVTPSETTVLKGKSVKLKYVLSPGYNFCGIDVSGRPEGSEMYEYNDNERSITIKNITEDTQVSLVVNREFMYYKVNATAGTGGTISPSGLRWIYMGETQIFQIQAASGYFIDSVYFDGVGKKAPKFTESLIYTYTTSKDSVLQKEETHQLRATFVEKKKYTLIVQPDSLSTCTPLGVTELTEGQNLTVRWSSKEFCSLVSAKVNGVSVYGSSYTINQADKDYVITMKSKKEPEWYLCKIKWQASMFSAGGYNYATDEILNFSSNGKFSILSNGKTTYDYSWTIDKTKTPPIFVWGGYSCTIDRLDEDIMIFHYIPDYYENGVKKYGDTVYWYYHNIGYK